MINMAERKKTSGIFKLWVSYPLKCISFHKEAGFELVTFTSQKNMWETIHEFVQQGYVVQ